MNKVVTESESKSVTAHGIFNKNMKAMQINRNTKKYYETAVREPEVDFEIVSQIEEVNYDGSFDYLSFCISPNYTPASADFIIDLIREYIVED